LDGQGELIAGRYRLRSRVGAGGMGVVWEAWDERLHRAVAVKLLRPAPGLDEEQANIANQRAMREARITARLHHRYAVPVFDVVEHEGQACLVMPFLPSVTLAAVLREAGTLSVAEAGQVGGQIGSALAAAHDAGIVHRDVKPGNVLITEDGTALISDFGIAHAFDEATLTGTGLIHGTPAYLAPEVAGGGEATYASDVFSFGATLYHALEGAPPFGTDQNSIALLHRIAAGQIEPPRRAGRLTPILLQVLDVDPRSRPSMVAAAQAVSGSGPALEGPVGQVVTSGASADTPTGGSTTPGRPTTASIAASEPTGDLPSSGTEPPRPEARPPAVVSQASLPAESRRRPWRRASVLVGALVLLGGMIIALLLEQNRIPTGATAGSGGPVSSQTSASASADVSTPASPSDSATQSGSPTGSATGSRPPSSPSSSTPSPQPTRHNPPTSRDLARAVTSYYALVPDHIDLAWPRMTADYQSRHAGGRTGYENFWRPVRRVTVHDVSGEPPDRATATITYYYRDGRAVHERTAYRLTNQRGALKIADSRVMSSRTT
jgi:eukaryotic-like serine/threonine-protein kinase